MNKKIHQHFLFSSTLLPVGLAVLTPVWALASPFAEVARPVGAIQPTSPPSVTVVIEKPVEEVPKPVVPQRIEILEDHRFIVLPEEAPMPGGTIAGHMFADESNTVTEGVLPAYLQPVPTPREPVQARLSQTADGYYDLESTAPYEEIKLKAEIEDEIEQVVAADEKAEASSPQTITAQAVAEVTAAEMDALAAAKAAPLEEEKPEETVVPTPAKPQEKPQPTAKTKAKPKATSNTATVKLTYALDGVRVDKASEQAALQAFVKKLDGTLVTDILLLAQTTAQPLGEERLLVHQRWRQILPELARAKVEAKGVRVSEILLQGQDQFLQLEVRYRNK